MKYPILIFIDYIPSLWMTFPWYPEFFVSKSPCAEVNPHYIAILPHRCVDWSVSHRSNTPKMVYLSWYDMKYLVTFQWNISTPSWNIPKSTPKSITLSALSHIFDAYPLVNKQLAIENCHSNRLIYPWKKVVLPIVMLVSIIDNWFTHWNWWFSIVMAFTLEMTGGSIPGAWSSTAWSRSRQSWHPAAHWTCRSDPSKISHMWKLKTGFFRRQTRKYWQIK